MVFVQNAGVTNCKRNLRDCVFIVMVHLSTLSSKLQEKRGDYTDSTVHLHDEITGEHMYWYWIHTRSAREVGCTV